MVPEITPADHLTSGGWAGDGAAAGNVSKRFCSALRGCGGVGDWLRVRAGGTRAGNGQLLQVCGQIGAGWHEGRGEGAERVARGLFARQPSW